MATKTPFTIDGTSQLGFNWKASSVEFTDGEDLQTKFDTKTIVPDNTPKVVLYSGTGVAEDGSMTQKAVTAQIESLRAKLNAVEESIGIVTTALNYATEPVQIEPLVYNGQNQAPNLLYSEVAMVVTAAAAKEVGQHQWVATLKEGYQWLDNTTGPKTGYWQIIADTNVTLQANKTNLALTTNYPEDEIKYTTNSDGELVVTSGDTNVATVNVDSTNRKVTVVGKETGTTNVEAYVKQSSNFSASVILRTPISVQFEHSIGLLWDGPNAGGTGWTRISGRSTASDIIPITNANYDPDNTWPFNQIQSITVSGYPCVLFPKMYHRVIQTNNANKIMFFIDSEQTGSNEIFASFTSYDQQLIQHDNFYVRSSAQAATKIGSALAKSDGTVFDIWDYHLLLRLALIDLNPGKSVKTILAPGTSWRGVNSLIPPTLTYYFIPGFKSKAASSQVQSILSSYHKYNAWSEIGTVTQASARMGNWNLGIAADGHSSLGQLFVDTTTNDTTTYKKSVYYHDYMNANAVQYGVVHPSSTSSGLTKEINMLANSPYVFLGLGFVGIDNLGSFTFYTRARGWKD